MRRLTNLDVEEILDDESHGSSQHLPPNVLHPVDGRTLQAEGESLPDTSHCVRHASPHAAVDCSGHVVGPGNRNIHIMSFLRT